MGRTRCTLTTMPTAGDTWRGTRVTQARANIAAQLPLPCAYCQQPVTPGQLWHLDHQPPRIALPETEWDNPQYHRASHAKCNTKAGAILGNKIRGMRRHDAKNVSALREAVLDRPSSWPAPFVPLSPSVLSDARQLPPVVADWLPDVPVPPSIQSPLPPGVVGSYGPEFDAWCGKVLGEKPRPWQSYVAARILEHDDRGELVHRRVGVSVPRQVGKSVLLRMLAAWRLHQADRFGEPQTVMHVAHQLNTTEEVFKPAVAWAKRVGLRVRVANGQMEIGVGESRWLPRSTQSGYGFTLSLCLVDEAWAVAPYRVNSGYAPTLSERRSGQIVMFSSANAEATPLFPRFREVAVSRRGWLILEWSADEGVDAGDESVWRAVTPVPVDGVRRELMADEWSADGGTFRFERLNQWPAVAGLSWGERVLGKLGPAREVKWSGELVGALESEPDGSGWGCAVSDGSHVECVMVSRLGAALGWLNARLPVRVLAHESVAKQVASVDERLVVTRVNATDARAATAVLRDSAGGLSWSGVLGDQLRNARVAVLGGVEVLDAAKSLGPVSAAKAASWALWSARVDSPSGAMIY
jgi:hypothetical protein